MTHAGSRPAMVTSSSARSLPRRPPPPLHGDLDPAHSHPRRRQSIYTALYVILSSPCLAAPSAGNTSHLPSACSLSTSSGFSLAGERGVEQRDDGGGGDSLESARPAEAASNALVTRPMSHYHRTVLLNWKHELYIVHRQRMPFKFNAIYARTYRIRAALPNNYLVGNYR